MRCLFNALIILLPFGGRGTYSNRLSYCGGRSLIVIVQFSIIIFVDGFNHEYR